jgi:hypothetical protein
MRWFKWSFRAVLLAVAALFLQYTLPSHDVVRITEVYNRITAVSWENKYFYASPDTGTAESTASRDIRFISAVYPDGKVIVYRNEDTGWIWPPYFKYDSSNLQAVASNLKSSDTAPKWVMVTHYGWRLPWLSIYPNAIRMTEVSGPDYSYFPWFNVIVLAFLAFAVFMLRRMWLQFVERVIVPARASLQDWWDRTRAWFGGRG